MLIIVFNFYVLVIAGVSGMITQNPLNVATDVGGETFFNCTSDRSSTNHIAWLYTKDGNILSNPTDLTENDCTIIEKYRANFKTEKPMGGNICNLILFNATLLLGGFYSCTDGIGAGTSSSQSILVVVDSNSQSFEYNATDPDVILSKEDLQISKTVTYGGPSLHPPVLPPSFYWTFESDTTRNVTSNQSLTASTSSSYIIVTAQPPTIPVYICNLFFNSPVNHPNLPPACAVNAPIYRFSWKTELLQVSYNSQPSITVIPHYEFSACGESAVCNESTVCEAKILTCVANAYPEAKIYWLDLSRNTWINSTSITGQLGSAYQCFTFNEIKGILYNSTLIHNISDASNFTSKACQRVDSTNMKFGVSEDCSLENQSYYNCNGHMSVSITCNSSALPDPYYEMTGPCLTVKQRGAITKDATYSGEYACTVSNTINNQPYIETKKFEIGGLPDGRIDCVIPLPEQQMCANLGMSDDACIALLVIVPILSLSIVFATVYLLLYGLNEDFRKTLNERFEWMAEMLPCFNKGCACSAWIVAFIAMSIVTGFIAFPVLIIMAYCSFCNSNKASSKEENMNLERRGETSVQSEANSSQTNQPSSPPFTPISTARIPPPVPQHQGPTRRNYLPSANNQKPDVRPPPSPVNPDGVIYQEMRIDSNPRSRKPVELITGEGAYAPLNIAS